MAINSRKKEIILGVTGSIAAYKAGDITRRLREAGFDVSVVMTKSAMEFITPLTLASLSGRRVYTETFEKDQGIWEMSHIHLAQEACAVLIAPATANIIGKIANGIADDLLSCLVLATKAPIFIAPAMNDAMYHNKIVQGNISKLKKLGIKFIDPIHGKLACGTTGEGHLADVNVIVQAVRSLKK